MKKTTYITPCISIQSIYHTSVLCGSDRVSSDIGLHGGDESGDQAAAF